jgi:hypothetical protein
MAADIGARFHQQHCLLVNFDKANAAAPLLTLG